MKLNSPKISQEDILTQLRSKVEPQIKSVKIVALAGDASNRSYYRLEAEIARAAPRTFILMVLADPEPFKQSEEKASGKLETREIPFINIQRYMRSAGIAVPEIYFHDVAKGFIYLEDLGDLTFEQKVKSSSASDWTTFYRKAVDELIRIQNSRREGGSQCLAFERVYDRNLLNWEFDHFIEYGIEKRANIALPPEELLLIRSALAEISGKIASEAQVLVHRDYHSRNLMVQGESLRVIDFQDALLGPPQYDLASLLRDCYITLPEDLIDQLVEYYLDHAGALPVNRKSFRYLLDLASLQRNMKAAGRFVFIDRVKNNPNFLQYVPKALKDISRNLAKYPEFKDLKRILAKHLPELDS